MTDLRDRVALVTGGGRGIGRSLVRTSARWAQRQGAHALMLNTQGDNEPALNLYESEGFEQLREPLAVLRAADVVIGERRGYHVHYRLSPEGLAAYRDQAFALLGREFMASPARETSAARRGRRSARRRCRRNCGRYGRA